MIGLRSFLQGKTLYDYIYSQYGPFYYVVQASLYTTLHLEVTHNAVRAIMAVFWFLTALLCAWSVYRLTRSWIFTLVGFMTAIQLLGFFSGSPGHPEELCIAFLMGLFICFCYLSDRPTVWMACLIGSLIAALALTKINIGCYAALATGLALLRAMPPGPKQKTAFATLSVAGLCLPVVILAPIFRQSWAPRIAIFVLLSIAAAILAAWFSETEQLATPALWFACVMAFSVVVALIVAAFLARGTTLGAMFYSTVLQHRDVAKNWYVALPVRTEWIAISSLMLAACWVMMTATFRARRPLILALNIVKILVVLSWFFFLYTNTWMAIYNLTVPFLWLILVPSTVDGPKNQPFALVALCLLSAFSALYPLPVAGAQGPFSLVLTIPIVCVFLNDAMIILARAAESRKPMTGLQGCRCSSHPGDTWLLATRRGPELSQAYVDGTRGCGTDSRPCQGSGQLPVANRRFEEFMRLQLFDAWHLQSLLLDQHHTTYRTINGQLDGSVEQRPTAKDHERSFRYSKALYRLQSSSLVKFWRRGQDLSASPLARYIQDGFVAYARRGNYTILVRRDQLQRQAPNLGGAKNDLN